ncbi:class I SAM-dependent methyltransferase [Kitasatospora sp. MAP5-34]|uniref:class I SAM-dependent methyltransferase n=1 Tax=Kitasatospora sp. MAP5-34 TaxID=3035102 RepID=UPI002473D64B|nr:class I SAM-dependent methyltransferase [Kitasatospora sp. MAP5-34]MDH6575588.1 SAM-dependent methyltransferase [Kitasatospora sp. MAP5-34]
MDLGYGIAKEIDSPELASLILGGRAFNASYGGDPEGGLDYALAAVDHAERGAPTRMEWTQQPGVGPGAEILGDDLTGRRIVELGCGAGHNTAHLAAVGARAIGVDRSAGQIRRAIGHYRHTGALFVHGSALIHLTRSAVPLHAVVSVFGAVGLTEPTRLLASASARLTPGGILAFAVPHPQRTGTLTRNPITRESVDLPGGSQTTVERWELDPAGWSRALNRSGLAVIAVEHYFAPVDARWPTTLLITARKP